MEYRATTRIDLGDLVLAAGDAVGSVTLDDLGADIGVLVAGGDIVPDEGEESGPAHDFVAALNVLDSTDIETVAALIAASEAACMALSAIGMTVQQLLDDTSSPPGEDGGGADRVDQIRSAVAGILKAGNPEDLTKTGKVPTVEAVEAATGIDDVSADERDEAVAWAKEQAA